MMTKAPFHESALALALALLLPAACGPKQSDTLPSAPPAASAPAEGHEGHAMGEGPEGHEMGHEHEGHEMGTPGSPIAKFHDRLAPLWHAPEGAQRVADTCAAAAELHGLANDIVMAGAGEGTKPDYLDATHKLVDAVAELHKECGTPDKNAFAAKFAAVHEAFHAVAERAAH